MDKTERKMTKIARELNKLTVQAMKEKGIGTAEFDFIHLVRHHPGITQAQLREELKIDKGAAARRAASLEAKGYLTRRDNPEDKRSLEGRGKDATYINTVFGPINSGSFVICIIAIFACALIGGWFGQKMMKKHFEKAGIVA